MAAPSYTEDLTDVDLAETTTGWSHWGGGNIALGAGTDFAIQGVNAVDGKISSTEKGPYFDNGAGITLGAGDHVYVWGFLATPGLSDTLALRGFSITIGSVSGSYVQYHVEGNDTYGATGRVGKCYPIDYSVRTSNTGSAPYRTVTGTPGANPRVFGAIANITASVKGSNMAVDAIRYGTGAYLTAGELISAGDASDDPATFEGFATVNDYNDATNGYNRWGILSKVSGSYELQGTFAIGQNNAGTATLCRFSDSDRNIVIVDTPHSATDFSKFIIDHASTRCEWNNINITALGTNNRGEIEVTSNDPDFIVDGGTWDGIGTVILQSNSALTGTTLRRTDAITLNSGTLDGVLVDQNRATSAVVATSLDDITESEFISDGTGHAVNRGTVSASVTETWDATDSGYAATNGSTGNETILVSVNSGQTLTISVADGASTPTIKNDGAGSVVVNADKAITFTGMKDNTEVRVYKVSDGSEVGGIENATAGTTDNRSFTWYAPAATVVNYILHNWSGTAPDYERIDVPSYTVPGQATTIPIQQRLDRNSYDA